MKRIVGSISLLILLLNTLGIPLTYAEEYAQESEKAEVVGDIPTDDVVENDEGEEQSPQFPVNENFDNDQEPEIDPVEPVNLVVENPEELEVPVVDEGSGGVVEHPVVNPEDDTTGSGGNQGGENGDNPDALSGGNQEAGSGTGGQVSTETDFSGGNTETSGTGGSSTEISEDEGGDSGIISNITSALQDFLSTIRFFFVSDDNDYIKESKINGIKTITLEDPENGETITIMDRNLGAEDSDITSEDSYGNYYQWGNNNGFEKVDGENVTSNLSVYSLKYEGVGYTRDNKFRVGGNDIWEVDEEGRSNYNELWYLGEDEEIQGPCPEGYHIPSDKEWNKLVRVWTKIHTVDENEGGKTVRSVKGDTLKASLEQAGTGDAEENTIEEENLTEVEELFMKELKLPKAGNYATNGEREDGLGIYWTRTPSDKSYQSEVFSIERYFGEDFDENLLNRANGNSVRCFLDTYEKEVVEYNKEEITGEETFDDVTVSVYAGTGFFPEGTKLLISPIVQEQEISDIKDKISEEDDNIIEDSKLVAFDISFIYRGEEVQPLEGKVVKVTFDYSNNDELTEADKIDEQEVKVFHIDDKDENGEKVEKGEEVVKDVTNIVESEENGIAVADAESFSMYLLTVSAVTTYTVHFDVNGGAGFDNAFQDQEIDEGGYVNRPTKDPYKVGYMFLGWFNNLDNDYRFQFQSTPVTSDLILYAKWAPFNDIVYCDNTSPDNCITLMDRNMGAIATGAGTSARESTFGYYYQRGNNYGFYYDKSSKTINKRLNNTVSSSGYGSNAPLGWFYGETFRSVGEVSWSTEENIYNLWGGGLDSSSTWDSNNLRYLRQGPCPRGYHIPSVKEWHDLVAMFLSNNGIADKTSSNYVWPNYVTKEGNADYNFGSLRNTFANTFFIPVAGRVQGAYTRDRQYNDSKKRAPFWSSTPSSSSKALGFELKFEDTKVNLGGFSDVISQGKVVRCFRDNDDFTVRWKNLTDNSYTESDFVVETDYYVNRDEHPHYDGDTPTKENSIFLGWYLEDGDATQIFTQSDLDDVVMDSNKTYIAKFRPIGSNDYNVEVEIIPSTGGTVSGTGIYYGIGTYYGGDNITLTGVANAGYEFSGWYDNLDNLITTDNPYSFTADSSAGTGLIAKFKLKEYIVSVTSNDVDKGTINVTEKPYTHGKRIVFSPKYDSSQYKFLKWNLNGTDVMDGNQYLTGDLVIEELTGDLEVIGYFSVYDTCTFNNQTIQHGWTVTGYQSSTVPYGQSCVSETRTCNNGILDGSYQYASCTVETPQTCTFNNQTIQHGGTITGYQSSTVPYGESCVSETRTCNNGILDGSYQYASCSVNGPATCDLPWGGTAEHGDTVIGYTSSSENCPNQCSSQTATCINGTWSVNDFTTTYTHSSCTTNGVETTGYPLNECPAHGNCSVITGYTVNENACVLGDTKRRLDSCDAHYHTGTNGDSCEIDTFEITWSYMNANGSHVEQVETVEYNQMPTEPSAPDYQTPQTGYTFIGWNSAVVVATEDKTYEAQYSETTRKYTVTWNIDGVETTEELNYGTKPAHVDPTKEQTQTTVYSFDGWYVDDDTTTLVQSGDFSVVTDNVKYTAHFAETVRKYEIIFKNGETELRRGEISYGVKPVYSGTEPTKQNTAQYTYSFSGWNDGEGSYASNDLPIVTKGVTYAAEFNATVNEYTIMFHSNDGTPVDPQIKKYGTTVDEPEDPTRTGYEFAGWYSDIGLNTSYNFSATIEGDVDLYAKWTIIPYSITYELNGGSLQEGDENPLEYTIETTTFTLNNPTRTGYTFIGWSGTKLEGSDNTNVTIVIGSVGDREYEANWQANKYNVTYKANGGVGVDVVEEATYNAKNVFTGSKFTRIGYRFVEWNTKSDGTGTGYTEGFSGIWKTTTGVNLYAQWTAETYTVTFDANEGEVVGDNTKEVSYDGEYGELPTATRLGYIFTGWYTEDTAGDKVEGETRVATANDHTLYAHWDENSYNVVYEGGIGSEGVATGATYRYTESFNLAANNFTKRGYSFSGWKNGDNYYAAGAELSRLATQNGATVTFTAEWNVVPYSITYELNGGIFSGVVNPTTYDVNSSTINVGNPEKVGYIFLGWTGTDLSALSSNVVITGGSIGDRTYYANWQARDDIKVTINHYLQDLDVDNNTVFDTYSISGTVKKEGTADSTINVSDYKQTIEGYSFDSGKVDGSVVSTTTVSPDGSRVIDLFYTRNSYSYAITTSVGSSTEGSSANGNYYYGAKIILSGDSNNDCFVWSGWNVQGATLENNMKQTSFIMPANDVTANSLVREKTYNIVFNGNGEDSGTMSPLNGIRCTQEFTLPENSFVKTVYTFTGWTTIPNGVKEFDNKATIQTLTTGDNVTIKFIAIWDKNRYPVVWKNYNGSVLYEEEVLYEVTPVYHGVDPSRDADEQYAYTFAGWSPGEHPVTGAQVYTAVYNQTVNEYTITWKDGDGNTLKTEQVAYGGTPEYTGATPTKTATAQYSYTFNNTWSPEVQSVTGDMTYMAQFDSTVNEYSVTWVDGDGVTLKTDQVAYGDTPEYTGAIPTKTATQEHTYTFKGWSPAVTSVTGPATYKAVFDGDVNEYAITWLDGDGNILKMETLEYGQMPSYSGSIPTKTADAQYTYTFNNTWSPAIVSVTTGATYTAQFSSTVNKYSIVWKDGDGNILKTDQVAYGQTPAYVGDTPTKTATAQYSYTFNNTWSPAIVSVTTGATYTAQFSSTVNKYSIVWKDGDGNILKTDQVAYGTTPVYSGATPTKTATAQYSYTFNNTWSPEIEDVTTGATYTAQFTPALNKYTIVWKDWNGTILKLVEELEYGTHPVYGLEDPTREGDAQYSYTFNGWNPAVQDVIGPQVYTATYLQTVNKYRIIFLNDDDSEITSKQVEYGTTVANYKPDDPTKEGYTFNGWNPNLVTVVTGSTYKATYTINQYTLTPELGVGLERIEGGGTFDYGTEVIFTGYAKEGYHFEGGERVKAFTVTVGAHNATVRINAIANKYVVKFQPNEGGGTMQDQEFTYDLTGVLHANSFRRSGYTFTGWIDEFGNYYADQGKVYNLVTGGVVEFTALWKVGEDKPVEPTPAAGGGRIIPKEDKDQEHGSADTQTGGTGDIDSGTQYTTGDIIPGDGSWTQEEMDAYEYAYKYHITTLAPREAARPNEYVIRGHMAKMVVNYAVNVLGWKLPEKLPKQCKWNDGVDAWESQEIKDYAEKACALGIMGIDMNYFQPNKYVTRAQFGTIFGRLLRGKLPSTPYYAAHLARLKEEGIMTQIENPEDRIEIRKWAWLMFMRSEKYFKVK